MVVFHTRTAATRSLDSVLLIILVCYFVPPPSIPSRSHSRGIPSYSPINSYLSESAAAAAALFFAPYKYRPTCSHHFRDTLLLPPSGPLTEVHNRLRRNILRNRVLTPCGVLLNPLEACFHHCLLQCWVLPTPTPPSTRLPASEPLRNPGLETTKGPLDPGG